MLRPLLLCLLLAGCASARPASIASDVSLPDTFLTALLEGRFDEARAVADRLQASGRIGASLRARLRLGKLTHDAALVRAIASDPHVDLLRADPLAWNELARAVLWTVSVADAAAFLESACEDARLPADNRNRMCTCSYAALGKLARERPMAIEGEPRTVVELMTKVPLPVVLASVDGKAPEPFIVDTGASTSILSRAFCDRAGIPYLTRHPQVGRSPGRDVTLFPALVDSIKVGGITVRNFPAQVMTFPPELEVGGILAPQEAFRGLVTEVDGRELKLRLYRDLDEEGWARLVGAPAHTARLTWYDGGVYLRGRVGTSGEAWFIFDTGGGSSTLSSAAAKAKITAAAQRTRLVVG